MPDDVIPKNEPEDNDELTSFIADLKQLSKGTQTVELATVAANGGPEGGAPAVESKQTIQMKPNGEIDEPANHVDPLRKNFEVIAKAHPDFKHFGSDKALDDPVGYLRAVETDIKGRPKYKVSNAALEDAIQIALVAGSAGKNQDAMNVWAWADRYKQSSAVEQAFQTGLSKGVFGATKEENMLLSKQLETGGGVTSGGPLIRVDIDPLLREAYLRKFPLYEMIRKFPANGLVHTYNQRTSAGTAGLVSEMGDLTNVDSESNYVRQANSHIAVLASRRQISLKLQYAVSQSGMNFNLSGSGNLEVTGALGEIARLDQSLICQGNQTIPGKTVNDEEGEFNGIGFDGFRKILMGAGTSITKATADPYLRTINRAVADIINDGGDVDNLVILCSLYARMDIEDELLNFLRVLGNTPGGFPTNLASNGILTVADTVSKLMPIPAAAQGEGLGFYTFGGNATEDLVVTDPAGIGLAFLGGATPSILELPVGFNNALSNVYIPFVMHGLVVFVTKFNRKIRIGRVTA